MNHRTYFWVGLALVFSLAFGPAGAEHEADHRYDVRGYVLDNNEAPISGASVIISSGTRSRGRAVTDSEGYYSVRLHLHDADIGSKLTVRTGELSKDIRMTAEAGTMSIRRHYLNFVGDRAIEGELPGWRFPAWANIAAPVALLLVVAAFVAPKIRRTIKRRAKANAPRPPERRKQKKSRKKKH